MSASGTVTAHVRYVTDADEPGSGFAFLASALSDPLNLLALGAGGLAVLLVILGYLHNRPFARDVAVFREVMASYRDLLPWLLRLGFGLPLVGAGFSGYLFTPVVVPELGSEVVRLFQVGLGFALLFGLATRAAALVGLASYLVAAAFEPLALYSLEWIPGFVAIALVGSGRPSADQTLHRIAAAEGTFYGRIDPVHGVADRLSDVLEPHRRYVPTVIRVGLGASFVFFGVFDKLFVPTMSENVVARYGLTSLVPLPADLWVLGAAAAELGLGIAIFVGFFTRSSALAALFVFTLTLFGLADDPVLAHVGLFSLASALLVTGAGPYSLDTRLGNSDVGSRGDETQPGADSAVYP